VVEVAPGDVQGYVDAILALQTDYQFYEQKRLSCAGYQEQFYDSSESWAAALRQTVGAQSFPAVSLEVANHL